MLISGVQKFTLLDYPEKTACIVFTAGCTFRCGYCHNPEFVLPEEVIKLKDSFIPEESFFQFLRERGSSGAGARAVVPLLDGVVVSGGEPTVQADLLRFLRRIKDVGCLVKLDTNGNRPDVVRQVVAERLVDYIAMDIKTSLAKYPELTNKFVQPDRIKESIRLIKASGVEYEFRSTLIKEVHTPKVLKDMAALVAGVKRWWLQTFRPGHTLDPTFAKFHPFSLAELSKLAEQFRPLVKAIGVR